MTNSKISSRLRVLISFVSGGTPGEKLNDDIGRSIFRTRTHFVGIYLYLGIQLSISHLSYFSLHDFYNLATDIPHIKW